MLTIILSGGIGAGKTHISNTLKEFFGFVEASPATVMKRSLAKAIATGYGEPDRWGVYLEQMMHGGMKEEYRLLLQEYGEFFSTRDRHYWAEKAAREAFDIAAALPNCPGVVGDSIRRDTEIMALKRRSDEAFHIRLDISKTRQVMYLTNVRGMSLEKAAITLAHSSEHWLDDMKGHEYDADFHVDANQGDLVTWEGVKQGLLVRGGYVFNEGKHEVTKVTNEY